MANPKKLKVDKEKCIACGTCYSTMPDYFEMDEEGKAKATEGKETSKEDGEKAVNICPVGAISYD